MQREYEGDECCFLGRHKSAELFCLFCSSLDYAEIVSGGGGGGQRILKIEMSDEH